MGISILYMALFEKALGEMIQILNMLKYIAKSVKLPILYESYGNGLRERSIILEIESSITT